MTLSGTGCLIDIDQLLKNGSVTPAFGGLEEACGKACMDWYADYYKVNWPHADNEEETGDFYTLESIKTDAEKYDLLIGDNKRLKLNALYRDGHAKDIATLAEFSIDNPSVVSISQGYLRALAAGQTQVTATYSDAKGQQTQAVFSVLVTGVNIDDFASVTSMSEIGTKPFIIMNQTNKKAFYGSGNQNLGFDNASQVVNNKEIVGYQYKAEPVSGRSGCYLLRQIMLNGSEYGLWGSPGYLNSQSADGWCCFILGLNNQNGQDIKDGAVWEIKHVADKGFTLKNMGTGLYLKDGSPAKYTSPEYFAFLVEKTAAGIQAVNTEQDTTGKGQGALTLYNMQGIKVGTLDELSRLPHGMYIVGGKKIIK